MRDSVDLIFFLSFFTTLLMGLVSYFNFLLLRVEELRHLTEFWASLFTMVLLSFVVRNETSLLLLLGPLGWIWPLRTIYQFLADISGHPPMNRVHFIALGSGAFVTFALATYKFSFNVYVAPFSIVTGLIGLVTVYQVSRRLHDGSPMPLRALTFFMFALFFGSRLLYPIIRSSEALAPYWFLLNLGLIIGFCTCTLSLYLQMMKERHEEQLQHVIRERNEQLFGQSKYAEMGMMSAGIAHEINNPLAIIQAKTSQLLRIYQLPERVREVGEGLQQVLATSERINRTIQGIREFVHQDEFTRVVNEIPVQKLLDDVLAFCGQRMKNHGINLRFYDVGNLRVTGHKIQLEQVLLNLFNNSFDAIEYLGDKWIEVRAEETPDTVRLYFKDSGPGIPYEIAERMMDPFFTTKKSDKGTGLGLALAKGIVEKHGGKLAYLPDQSHTTFLLELPKRAVDLKGVPQSHLPMFH